MRAPLFLMLNSEQLDFINRPLSDGVLIGQPGAGKCLGYGTPVMMADGHIIPVQDLVVGDLLMGDDSSPRMILSLARGREELFRICPVDGEPFVVNKSHILCLRRRRYDKTVHLTVHQYIKHSVQLRGYRTRTDFQDVSVQIHPMLIGPMLQSGCLQSIPYNYKCNSRYIRWLVLRSVLPYANISSRVQNDVQFIARSLGFRTKMSDGILKIYGPVRSVQTYKFTVQALGVGDYYGFEITGNRRFLLGDFTVTHNTRSIITRICRQVDAGILPPDKFMILTFSRLACRDFVHKGDSTRKNLFGRHNVRTLHSLAGKIVHKCNSHVISSIHTVISRALQMCASMTAEELRSCIGDICNIIVDEAQDISSTQYDFVVMLGSKLGCPIVMVGDPNQSIYGFQGGNPMLLLNHPGWRVQLRLNYRSTRRIVEVANAIRPCADVDEMLAASCYVEDNDAPQLIYGCEVTIAADLLKKIQMSLDNNRTVAVIAPTKRCYSGRNPGTPRLRNLGLQWAANCFARRKIAFQTHYDETSHDNDTPEFTNFSPKVVHLLTIHGSKGLEFDDVYLLNFHVYTYGYEPSLQEIQTFRFMWFVAVTRPKRRLTCYSLKWREAWNTDPDLFDIVGMCTATPTQLKEQPASKKGLWTWTALLNDRVALPEHDLSIVEDGLIQHISCVSHVGFHSPLPEWDRLKGLLGRWAEAYFEYCYTGALPHCAQTIERMILNTITVPFEHVNLIKTLRKRFTLSETECFTRAQLYTYCEQCPELEPAISKLLGDVEMGDVPCHMHIPNNCQWFDADTLRKLMRDWNGRLRALEPIDIFHMQLFVWQYECEAKYRWYRLFGRCDYLKRSLRPFADNIQSLASTWSPGWQFQVPCEWNDINIVGIADAVHFENKHIVEFKFSKRGFQVAHAVQLAGYTQMLAGDSCPDWTLSVYNLYTNSRHDVTIKKCTDQVINTLKRATQS